MKPAPPEGCDFRKECWLGDVCWSKARIERKAGKPGCFSSPEAVRRMAEAGTKNMR